MKTICVLAVVFLAVLFTPASAQRYGTYYGMSSDGNLYSGSYYHTSPGSIHYDRLDRNGLSWGDVYYTPRSTQRSYTPRTYYYTPRSYSSPSLHQRRQLEVHLLNPW